MATEQIATNSDATSFDEVDVKIATFIIESPAMTDDEIAKQVGLSRQTVNRRRNSPEMKKLLRSVLAIPEREIRRLTAKALMRLETLLDDENPKVRLAATLALAKLSAKLMTNSFQAGFLDI